MVKKQTHCKNQIKSILHFYGIQIPEELANGSWSKRFINWIEDIRTERASGNFALKVHLEELNKIRKIISDITRGIRTIAKSEEYQQNVRLLKTVPEISTLTAMILLTELYDISRFKNFDKLAATSALFPIRIPAEKQT